MAAARGRRVAKEALEEPETPASRDALAGKLPRRKATGEPAAQESEETHEDATTRDATDATSAASLDSASSFDSDVQIDLDEPVVMVDENPAQEQLIYEAIDDAPTYLDDDAVEPSDGDDEVENDGTDGGKRPTDVCLHCGSTTQREGDCEHAEIAHLGDTEDRIHEAIRTLQASWHSRRRAERALRRMVEGKEADGEAVIEHTPTVHPRVETATPPGMSVSFTSAPTPTPSTVGGVDMWAPLMGTPTPPPVLRTRRKKGPPEGQVAFAFATPSPEPEKE